MSSSYKPRLEKPLFLMIKDYYISKTKYSLLKCLMYTYTNVFKIQHNSVLCQRPVTKIAKDWGEKKDDQLLYIYQIKF